eukprot:TRINITY_DN5850_c0_g1_i1.p1 TRINITY_DN5850_c0_g1~~TRINITY_DN5850_c0_g1_i1.p1  ORF type:complete len:163 (+),score=11.92 TRINITY_DN5850_c0_g1_i1:54-542(+)
MKPSVSIPAMISKSPSIKEDNKHSEKRVKRASITFALPSDLNSDSTPNSIPHLATPYPTSVIIKSKDQNIRIRCNSMGPTIIIETEHRKSSFFGIKYSDVVKNPLSYSQSGIPHFLEISIEHLHTYGLNCEGIFRIDPSRQALDSAIAKIEKGIKFFYFMRN